MSENQEILQKKIVGDRHLVFWEQQVSGVWNTWVEIHVCVCVCMSFIGKYALSLKLEVLIICQEHESALKFSLSKIENILMKSKPGFQMVVTFWRLTLSFDFLSVTAAARYCSFSLVLLHYLYKMLFVYESIFMIGDGQC